MTKKIWGVFCLMLLAGVCYGENMDFVTVMSSPVGSFTNLETADPGQYARSAKVNFCNSEVNSGSITIAGTTGASLGNLVLAKGGQLSSDAAILGVNGTSGIQVFKEGSLNAKQMMASQVNVSQADEAYLRVTGNNAGQMKVGGNMSVRGAGTKNLTIVRGSNSQDTFVNGNNLATVKWSNEYRVNYNNYRNSSFQEGDAEPYANEYLLKGASRSVGHIVGPNSFFPAVCTDRIREGEIAGLQMVAQPTSHDGQCVANPF